MAFNGDINAYAMLRQHQQPVNTASNFISPPPAYEDDSLYDCLDGQPGDRWHAQQQQQQQQLLTTQLLHQRLQYLKQQRLQRLYREQAWALPAGSIGSMARGAPFSLEQQRETLAETHHRQSQQAAGFPPEYFGNVQYAAASGYSQLQQQALNQRASKLRQLKPQLGEQLQQRDSLSSDFHPTITAERPTSSSGTDGGSSIKRKLVAEASKASKKAKQATAAKPAAKPTKRSKPAEHKPKQPAKPKQKRVTQPKKPSASQQLKEQQAEPQHLALKQQQLQQVINQQAQKKLVGQKRAQQEQGMQQAKAPKAVHSQMLHDLPTAKQREEAAVAAWQRAQNQRTQMQQVQMQLASMQADVPMWQRAALKVFEQVDIDEFPGWTVADAMGRRDKVADKLASFGYNL